jgi:hypothetical protein
MSTNSDTPQSDDQETAFTIVHEGERPAYSEDGVDLTLIRWMLSLTPSERLQVAQDGANSIQRLQDAWRRTQLRNRSEDSHET